MEKKTCLINLFVILIQIIAPKPVFLAGGLQHTFGLLLGFYYRQLPNVENHCSKVSSDQNIFWLLCGKKGKYFLVVVFFAFSANSSEAAQEALISNLQMAYIIYFFLQQNFYPDIIEKVWDEVKTIFELCVSLCL